MARVTLLVAAIACVLVQASLAPADVVINGGFETGDFQGWTTTGVASVDGTSIFGPLAITPAAGARQAVLANAGTTLPAPVSPAALESFLSLSPGTLELLRLFNGTTGPVQNGSALLQTVTVAEGDVLTFQWNYATNEFVPAFPYDFSFVVIGGTAATLATANSIGAVGGTTSSGYRTYTHTFDAAGTYLLGLGVVNTSDNAGQSRLYVDGFSINAATVPEPTSITVFATAFAVIGVAGWRRHRRAAER